MVSVLYLLLAIGVVTAGPKARKTTFRRFRPTRIRNREHLLDAVAKIFSNKGTRGAAEFSRQLVSDPLRKGELLDRAFKNLDRSPFVGVIPRCFCRYLTCNLPFCFTYCNSDLTDTENPLDCLSCLGECIPEFMRCVTGS